MNSPRQRPHVAPDPGGDRTAAPALALALLDGPRLTAGGTGVHLPSRSRRLLALLALRGPVTRALAAGYLWPEVSESRARASVRAAVRDLQTRVPAVLRVTPAELSLGEAVRVDVRELRDLARRLLVPVPDDDALAGGLDLLPGGRLGGELLPGRQDDWAVAEAERLHQLRLHVLDALVDHLTVRQAYAQALQVALAAVSVDPLRESTHRAVMRVFLAEGNTVEALRQYERFRSMVRLAMGIEPSRQMVDLVDEIAAGGDRHTTLAVVRRQP